MALHRMFMPALIIALALLPACGGGELGATPPAGPTELLFVGNPATGDTVPDGSEPHVWILALDGTVPRSVADAREAVWSPDGSRIAIVRLDDVARTDQLIIMDADGANQRILAPSTAGEPAQVDFIATPVWSPDGSRIAFTASTTPSGVARGDTRIFIADADGTGLRTIFTPRDGDEADDYTPAWSPDGASIAFSRSTAGGLSIFVGSADGGDAHDVSQAQLMDINPVWSPDGRQILFMRRTGTLETIVIQLAVMNADGTDLQILSDIEAIDALATWSPDGSEILFIRGYPMPGDDSDVPRRAAYVMRADGSNVRQLPDATANVDYAVWSPDGQQIAYVVETRTTQVGTPGKTEERPIYDLRVMDSDGRNEHTVAGDLLIYSGPGGPPLAWRPAAASVSTGAPPIVTTSLDDQALAIAARTVHEGGFGNEPH